MDITRNAAGALPPARLADYLRTLALIPGSFSPASVTALLQAAADRIDIASDQPDPWNLTEAQRRQFREAHAAAQRPGSSDQSEPDPLGGMIMTDKITGNETIDKATAWIAVHIGRSHPEWESSRCYLEAGQLRDAIMTAPASEPAGPRIEALANEAADLMACQQAMPDDGALEALRELVREAGRIVP